MTLLVLNISSIFFLSGRYSSQYSDSLSEVFDLILVSVGLYQTFFPMICYQFWVSVCAPSMYSVLLAEFWPICCSEKKKSRGDAAK